MQDSTEPGQQLELIPATPSIQPYPQQILLQCDELHFNPPNQPQQLNQSQVPYSQHFNTSLNSSSVSLRQPVLNPFFICTHSNTIVTPTKPVLNPFLTSVLIQTPSSHPPPTPSFQMPTSQDNIATLTYSYLTLLSQSQVLSTPPLTTPNPLSQRIYPNFQHAFQSSPSTLRESHHTPPISFL